MEDPLSGIFSTIDKNNDIDGIHFISSPFRFVPATWTSQQKFRKIVEMKRDP